MRGMKKICFVTTVSLTLDVFVLEFAKYLHDNTDWDITFVCNEDEAFANRLPKYIHFHPIPMKRGISVAGVKAMLEMWKFFKEQKFDLIQYSTPNASLYAAMAGKFAKIPVRLYCQWGMVFVGFTGLKRRIFKTIEKAVCRLSTRIEPDSNSSLKFAHEEGLYPESAGAVIWNGSACGVDLHKFDRSKKDEYRKNIRERYGIPEDAFVFGYVGRVTREKGMNELLESAESVIDGDKNIYLFMVGSEEVDDTIDQNLYGWSKNCPQVVYTGYTRVVEQFMSAMDCFVLPSYREGFGMSVIEAEAMGVSVIITDIPGPVDGMLKDKTGLAVPKMDAKALKAAMDKLAASPDLCQEFGKNGVEYVSQNFEQKELFRRMCEDRKALLSEEKS